MRRGRRTASDHLVVSALLHDPTRTGGHRLGLAVAKTAGHAPARARLRRLLREAFRAVRHRWPRAADLVVLAKKPWPEATLWSVTAELAEAAERLRLN
jgi:ribonuclease P protein component